MGASMPAGRPNRDKGISKIGGVCRLMLQLLRMKTGMSHERQGNMLDWWYMPPFASPVKDDKWRVTRETRE